MNPKTKLSSMVVFASVFLGSFLGAGITLITTPKTVTKEINSKIKGTAQALKENINEQLDTATVRVIENSTRLLEKSKTHRSKLSSVVDGLKKKFLFK